MGTRATTAGHHADTTGTTCNPGARLLKRVVLRQPPILEDVRLRPKPLRAVMTILRAKPGLQIDQVVDLDRVAEMSASQPCSSCHDLQHFMVRGGQNRLSMPAARRRRRAVARLDQTRF